MEESTLHKILSTDYPVYFGHSAWNQPGFLQTTKVARRYFILTDENVASECLPDLVTFFPGIKNAPVFAIAPGEHSKDPVIAGQAWQWLSDQHAERSDLLFNLGGGVVTDLGGFVASTFKRGMRFINLPTSLIGMADAAIGGKTGINLSGIKNQVGLITNPAAVIIDPVFLITLPERERISGYAEIIKSSLLSGPPFWEQVIASGMDDEPILEEFIFKAVNTKLQITAKDPFDLSYRKCLNFGHTFGHAFETMALLKGRRPLSHGEAVAAGMICEGYISMALAGLPSGVLDELTILTGRYYPDLEIPSSEFDELCEVMIHDKKNRDGRMLFSLLAAPGFPVIDQPAEMGLVRKAFEYCLKIYVR